ncbi:hypothetical protein [Acinetobacter nosocomialis]|uniref:hypothetical protein n=1 Tax=Acinetobacter nosocomialis TaxID=106654 RepID=UPI000A35B903|nr:hypothetical protein [Acinetobacter nosocomialis]OTL12410.1 hypothetical protein B9X80_14110 [Acinetobacter nosocomialis]
MKPEQFIREFGVEAARKRYQDIREAANQVSWVHPCEPFAEDLKRLVESLDRFNKFEDKQEALDAIDDAPEGATDYRKLSCGTRYIKQGPRFFEYWNGSEWCRPTVPFTVETHILRFDKLEDLKQSIKDHESIYGGGDE